MLVKDDNPLNMKRQNQRQQRQSTENIFLFVPIFFSGLFSVFFSTDLNRSDENRRMMNTHVSSPRVKLWLVRKNPPELLRLINEE